MLKFWQDRFDVPFDKDRAHRFIPWVMGLMIFLATLALVAAATVRSIVVKWDHSFAAGFTVELTNTEQSSPDERALDTERQQKAVQILQNLPGVANAQVISKTTLSRALGSDSGLDAEKMDVPLSTLIDVEVREGYQIDMEKLNMQLSQVIPGTLLRDHREWREKALCVAQSLIWISLIMASFIGVSAVLTIAFVTYTGLEVHHRIIEVLHLIGARNSYIARQFQEHALQLAVKGGILGVVLSTVILMSLGHLLNQMQIPYVSEGIPTFEIGLIIILTPLIALILTAFSARLTVISTVTKRMASS